VVNARSGLLLDADVLAELRSPRPAHAVVEFLRERRLLWAGVSALAVGQLADWNWELQDRYPAHVLPVDSYVAAAWAGFRGRRELTEEQALLAATASHHGLVVVSGQAGLYRSLGLHAVDPWDGAVDAAGSGDRW
jgi:predicted nucleic acid-binding protein